MSAENTSATVLLQSETWSRDSHGLYDYESRNVVSKPHQLSAPSALTRCESSIEVTPLGTALPAHQELLFSILYDNNGPYIAPTTENIWLIVKELPTACVLQENDIIKVGRMQMRVKALKKTPEEDSEMTRESSEDDTCMEVPSERDSAQCRICLYEDSEPDNPLITPCGCTGTVKYLHLQCLQKWIQSRKVTRESENSVNFYWKTMDCELCQKAFPLKVLSEGKKYNLFSEDCLQGPGIVLESFTRAGNNGIHAISLINKFHAKLGRGHDSDIRVSDISVSRVHASVEYRDSKFYFSDNNSKFGSLLLLREPLKLGRGCPVHLQVGRSIFTVTLAEDKL